MAGFTQLKRSEQMSGWKLLNRRDAIFFLLSLALVLLYVMTADGGFPLDDSWIHQVYARNLGDNQEWAFISGEPSAASTSPLYTVLLSIAYTLNLPYAAWTHLLGAVALAVAGMLGARLAEIVRPNSRGIGWAAGLAMILSWHLIWAAASGMETIIFATFTLALIYLVWREFEVEHDGALLRGVAFGAIAALATSTRPEGVGLAGLCGAVMLLRLQREPKATLRWIAGSALGFAVCITPYLLLNLSLAGGLLPNTADAKFVQHAPIRARYSFAERYGQLLVPILAGGQLLLLPGVLMFVSSVLDRVRADLRQVRLLLPVLWFLVLVGLYAARLPAVYQHGRYVMPALPAFIVVGVVGMFDLVSMTRFSMWGRVISRTLAIAALVAFVYFAIVIGPAAYKTDVQIIDEEMVANAHWIQDNLDPEELLAIHDIGAVGYFAPRPIVDIAGLVTPEVIDLIGNEQALWDYMRDHHAVYFMAFPDQIPGDDPDDPRLCVLHQSDGSAAVSAGGNKMTIYRLNWSGQCN
jgi:hypothetical protein